YVLPAIFETPDSTPHRSELISDLIATGVSESNERLISIIAPSDAQHLKPWQLGALSSLMDGLDRKKITLAQAAHDKEPLITRLNLVFDWAESLSTDAKAKEASREAAIHLLGRREA